MVNSKVKYVILNRRRAGLGEIIRKTVSMCWFRYQESQSVSINDSALFAINSDKSWYLFFAVTYK